MYSPSYGVSIKLGERSEYMIHLYEKPYKHCILPKLSVPKLLQG